MPVDPSRSADTARLKKASSVVHRLATVCGQDHSRVKIGLAPTPGGPDGCLMKVRMRVAGGRSHRWKAPWALRIPFFFAEARVMRPLALGPGGRKLGWARARYGAPMRKRGATCRACRENGRARGPLPFAGVGLAWWDRRRRGSLKRGTSLASSESPAGGAAVS